MKHHYTHEDVGCWIDGALGLFHAHQKLAYMLRECLPSLSTTDYEMARDCAKSLEEWLIDAEYTDGWELDLATDVLQHMLTAPGLVWIWETGDLILTTEDQLD